MSIIAEEGMQMLFLRQNCKVWLPNVILLLWHAAPEVLLSRSRYEAHRADLWSSGVLLYAMLFCRYPFERVEDANSPQRHQALIRRILAGILIHYERLMPLIAHQWQSL